MGIEKTWATQTALDPILAGHLLSCNQLVRAWLHAKASRSDETHRAYEQSIDDFRRFLLPLDLDAADPRQVRARIAASSREYEAAQSSSGDGSPHHAATTSPAELIAEGSEDAAAAIALAAQTWAARGAPAPTTHNRRLAVISSFYSYCLRQGLLRGPHPLQRVERRRVQDYAHARALDRAELASHLAAIPRDTPQGQRDYALLLLALHTGRRAAELAALRCGHLHVSSRTIVIHWPHLKGGKTLDDALPLQGAHRAPGTALRQWLRMCYGSGPYLAEAPVWPSGSRNGSRGGAISARSIANLCEKWLGMSQVHALRHTFAKTMEEAGATSSEIQARLGHTSLAVTGRYLARLSHSENRHLGSLSSLYGLAADDEESEDDAHHTVTRSNT